VSKVLQGPEMRYQAIEKVVLHVVKSDLLLVYQIGVLECSGLLECMALNERGVNCLKGFSKTF